MIWYGDAQRNIQTVQTFSYRTGIPCECGCSQIRKLGYTGILQISKQDLVAWGARFVLTCGWAKIHFCHLRRGPGHPVGVLFLTCHVYSHECKTKEERKHPCSYRLTVTLAWAVVYWSNCLLLAPVALYKSCSKSSINSSSASVSSSLYIA